MPERAFFAPFESIAEEWPLPLALRDGGRLDEGEDVEAVWTLFASTIGDACEGYGRFADESGGDDSVGG